MKNRLWIVMSLWACFVANAQQVDVLGLVTDGNQKPVSKAHLHFGQYTLSTNPVGEFELKNINRGTHRLIIAADGFHLVDTTLTIQRDMRLHFKLTPLSIALSEVELQQRIVAKNTSAVVMQAADWQRDYSGSFAQSLTRISGVNAIEIGAGTAKPVIRGLGFQRMVVAENGMRHEGQQWGAEHGLEMDAFQARSVRIVKGPAAIEYGSDAMGGVMEVENFDDKVAEGWSGATQFFTRSINQTLTQAAQVYFRKGKWIFKSNLSASVYGDYYVPTDTIVYLTVLMPVPNRRLKNTAGREFQYGFSAAHHGEQWKHLLQVQSYDLKAGFFPGAHGVPSPSRVQDDGDRWNIDFPFQNVQHHKFLWNVRGDFGVHQWHFSTAVQQNFRQEWSLFHTHYSGQPRPEFRPDLELQFVLNTAELRAKYKRKWSAAHESEVGFHSLFQQNTIDGYNFLLPEYRRGFVGWFAKHQWIYNEHWTFDLGLRWDEGQVSIDGFFDPLLQSHLLQRGRTEEEARFFATRSREVFRRFSQGSAQFQAIYEPSEKWLSSMQLGSVFRFPTAIELASNGIHHGSFRHEVGDASLNPERGWQWEWDLQYRGKSAQIQLTPYVYYFQNYLFLRPSLQFSPLPHGGQIFSYSQSRALIAGVEFSTYVNVTPRIQSYWSAEYIFNQQITERNRGGFALPFSPPANAFVEWSYLFESHKKLSDIQIFGNSRVVLTQHRTAQNEPITPGFWILGAGARMQWDMGFSKTTWTLQAHNLLNKRYFNHMSFYRALEIPEMGRNIQLMLQIPF